MSELEIIGDVILTILLEILSRPVALKPDSWDSKEKIWSTVTGLNAVNSESAF